MSDPRSAPNGAPLPDRPSLEWLRKVAKHRLAELRAANPQAQLADAQFALAKHHGFSSWRALKAHVDALTVEGQAFELARSGDAERLRALIDQHPDLLRAGNEPYGHTLLHVAAHHGQLDAVNMLLARGADPNAREHGDNTYPMHWAAAAGKLDVVRALADAGGDAIGHGDDHQLEIIGWATCWDGCDDDAHRRVVDLLVSRGARHHIFSAIATRSSDEVRRIVARDHTALSRQMSRNENRRLPLHFAVLFNRPDMVRLLLELGADPTAGDDGGMPAVVYAAIPKVPREVIAALVGDTPRNLFSALALHDYAGAERLLHDGVDEPRSVRGGALHLLSKRGDVDGVRWLLDRGADVNARWAHWDSEVTPLHLAVLERNTGVAALLLDRGADPAIPDTKHHSGALGWAEFFGHEELAALIRSRRVP